MTRRRRQLLLISIAFFGFVAGGSAVLRATGWHAPLRARVLGGKTVADRLGEFGPAARARWSPHFSRAAASYPPARVTLVGLKAEKRLDVYAAGADGVIRFVRSYPILAASGDAGPKLRRGDRQVPEGVYAVESLNPNSRFHVSLRVGYPNVFDREMAAADGRAELGSDIMIHGSNVSVGCLAMGDEAAEDLFVLAAETGVDNVKIVLSPASAGTAWPIRPKSPPWTAVLYTALAAELGKLPPPAGIE
jgi:hypothetical protein